MYEFLNYRAEDVMTRDAVTVAPETTLAECEEAFERGGFNALPVVSSGRLVGWLTKLDLLKAFRFDDQYIFPPYGEIMERPASSVMVEEIMTVAPREPLTKVLEKLVSTRDKSFPVVDHGRLVGIVAREDVLSALRRAALAERAAS